MLYSINAKGVLLCNQAVLRIMLKQEPKIIEGRGGSRSLGRGCIVNVASAASVMSASGNGAYATSKHAVLGVTRTAGNKLSTHQSEANSLLHSGGERSAENPGQRCLPFLDGNANHGNAVQQSPCVQRVYQQTRASGPHGEARGGCGRCRVSLQPSCKLCTWYHHACGWWAYANGVPKDLIGAMSQMAPATETNWTIQGIASRSLASLASHKLHRKLPCRLHPASNLAFCSFAQMISS